MYIAYLWKQSLKAQIDMPNITDYGWFDDGSIHMTNDIYPIEIKDIYDEDQTEDIDGEHSEDIDGEHSEDENLQEEFDFCEESDADTDDDMY